MNKLKSLVAGAALVGALAAGPTQEATAQEQQGPRWNIRTSAEFMPNSTREVPDTVHIDWIDESKDIFEERIIPDGMRDVRNEIRHSIALYDSKNGNRYGISYNALNPSGLINNPEDGVENKKFDFKEMNYDVSINTLRKMLQLNLEGRVDGKWTSNEFMFRPGKSPVHVGYGFETYGAPFEAISHKLKFLLDIGSLKSNSDSKGVKVTNAFIPDSISSKIHLKSTDNNKEENSDFYDPNYISFLNELTEEGDEWGTKRLERVNAFLSAFEGGARHLSTEAHWDLNNSIKRHINSGAKHLIPSGITLKHDGIGRVNGIGDSTSLLLSKINADQPSEFNRTNKGTSVKLSWDIPLGRSRPTTNQ